MSTADISPQALSFDQQNYPSAAFAALLTALKVPALSIDVASVERDEDGGKNFELQGTTQLFAQGVTVTLYIDYVATDKFEFQFQATLPSLTLQALRDHNILPDNRFVKPLVNLPFAEVQFTFDSEGEILYFGCLESDQSLGFTKLPLGRLGFEFLRNNVKKNTLLDFYAEIKIGSTPIEVKIEIPLGGSLSPQCWSLTSRSSIPLGSWLSDLTQFLEQSVGVQSANVFPESLKSVGTFFLDDVQVILDPDPPAIQFLSFRLKSVRDLPISDSLILNKVGLRVDVTPEDAEVALTLFGHVKIKDDANLDIQIMLPGNLSSDPWDLFMSGDVDLNDLSDLQHLPVGHKVEDLKLHPNFLTLKSVALKKLEVAFNPIQKTVPSIGFDLIAFAECELIQGLKLKDPRIELNAINPFSQPGLQPKSLTGAISGTIGIDTVNFEIRAEKLSDGWKFTGATAPGFIHLNQLIAAFKTHGAALPKSLEADVTLNSLSVEFTTTTTQVAGSSTSVSFNAVFGFPITTEPNAKTGLLTLNASVTEEAGKYRGQFDGELSLGPIGFGTKYSEDPQESFFVGAYTQNDNLKLNDLLVHVSQALADLIPPGLGIVVKDAVFGFAKPQTESQTDPRKFLLGIDLGIQFDFSSLPVVGKYFSGPAAKLIGFDNLQIVFASQGFGATEVQKLNGLLSTFTPPPRLLPEIKPAANSGNVTPPDPNAPVLQRGANVAAVLNLGGSSRPLSFPASPAGSQTYTGAQPVPNATTADSAIWLDIQKALGPVQFERVGVEYRDSKVWVLLSASLTAAGLTIGLDGLSIGASPSDLKDVAVSLRGLTLDYRNDVVEIGGSFLRMPVKDGAPPEYSGAAVIKVRGITITAFGSYTRVKEKLPGQSEAEDKPSFFIYGLLDYPIGGPSFFFVTGLAAGFGYDRQLRVPPIETVGQFALIKAAQKDPAGTKFDQVLAALQKDVLPYAGEHFLAAGITFTSFKLIESTVLLTAAFGKKFELHLLGLSKLRLPAAVDNDSAISPVAEVELALKGSFIPDDGFLELRAQLTPTSYLFKNDCHLSGGFAFLFWFKPASGVKSPAPDGDFVLTLGGYHPQFHKPDHYPVVPRLAFIWQVIPETLSLKGDVYFALTSAAVMAGGHLQAEWRSGSVFAWFRAGVDFLIAWKPYHYDAEAYIDIGVEVTFQFFGTQRISLDVGADLHIWGPEFAGDATIHLWIISFTIHFGDTEASKPVAIKWDEFQSSFLLKEKPAAGALKPDVCSVAVKDGLVRKGNANDLGIINSKHFCLVTDSRIPSTTATTATQNASKNLDVKDVTTTFGIASMDVASVTSSTHSITIMRGNAAVGDEFEYRALGKNVPTALWGHSLTPQIHGPQFVDNALCGFEIRPRKPEDGDVTPPIDRSKLVIHDPAPQQCRWQPVENAFRVAQKSADDFKKDLGAPAKSTRDVLLKTLGMDTTGLDDSLAYDFLRQPQSEAA